MNDPRKLRAARPDPDNRDPAPRGLVVTGLVLYAIIAYVYIKASGWL